MGHFGLAGYTEVATIVFLTVFVGAAVWAYLPSNRGRWAVLVELPLSDAPLSTSNSAATQTNQNPNQSESNEVL